MRLGSNCLKAVTSGGVAMLKRVLFIADSSDSVAKLQQALSGLDIEMAVGSALQIGQLATSAESIDLVIIEARGSALARLAEVASLVEERACPLLIIIDELNIGQLRLPLRSPGDFMTPDAGSLECRARVRRLLDDADDEDAIKVIAFRNMVVNLATYQVTVANEPVDFTYLEYTLLAFLVQHPDRAFSRNALLQSVWGLDYFGGSRTVDVHVRRIRAKLGPGLAQHLETVRGVGYLWRSR